MSQAALKNTEYMEEEIQTVTADPQVTVGLILRAAREARHEHIDKVSRTLRISETYLDALESDDRGRLPELVYTIGFLKTYARYLNIDPDALVQKFKQQFTHTMKAETLIFPSPAPERSIPTMTLVIIAGVLALLIAIAWLYLRPTSEVIDEFQHLTPVVNTDLETVPEVSAAKPVEEAKETQVAVAPAPQLYTQAYPIFPVSDARPYEETRAAKIHVTEQGIYLAPAKTFTLHARSETWVEIRDNKGQVVYSKTMKDGESQELPVSQELRLTTGNAAGLTFYVNGKHFSDLGKEKEVMRNKTLFFELPTVPAQ